METEFLVPSSSSRNYIWAITVKKYAIVCIKRFLFCPNLLNFPILFQVFLSKFSNYFPKKINVNFYTISLHLCLIHYRNQNLNPMQTSFFNKNLWLIYSLIDFFSFTVILHLELFFISYFSLMQFNRDSSVKVNFLLPSNRAVFQILLSQLWGLFRNSSNIWWDLTR